ncbi:MAG: hypothetical protein ACUZ8H_05410 [Candidatus Anammoxibacter sp.]
MAQASQQLIVLEKLNPVDLFKPNGLDSVLKEIDEKARSVILAGIDTQKDRDNIRAIAAKVGSTKSTLQKIGTKYTETMRAAVKESNAERDRGVTILQTLQEDIRKPLTEYEEAEKQRVADADRAIEILSDCATFADDCAHPSDSETIKTRIDELNLRYENLSFSGFSEDDEQKYKNRADHIYNQTRRSLARKLEQELQHESDKKELAELRETQEKQRKKDEDDKIRQEAADKAKAEAEEKSRIERESSEKAAADTLAAEKEKSERVEREKKEAERKAEEERSAKIAALEKAETDKIEAKKQAQRDKEAAVQAEQDRLVALGKREEAARKEREADKKHREKINNNAIAAIEEVPGLEELSEGYIVQIIEAIAESKIPRVTISY